MPRLNKAAVIPQIKNTFEGEKISEMAKKANSNVPLIKPNCTILVRLARRLFSVGKFLTISGSTAFPANHKEVQRNCAITIVGRMYLVILVLLILILCTILTKINLIEVEILFCCNNLTAQHGIAKKIETDSRAFGTDETQSLALQKNEPPKSS